MKTRVSSIMKLSACLLLAVASCKNDRLQGPKTNEPVKVYLPYAEKPHALVDGLAAGVPTIDSSTMSVEFPVPVYRGGEGSLSDVITVTVAGDNTAIPAIIALDSLSNPVAIDPADLVLPATDTLKVNGTGFNPMLVGGNIMAKIKISSLSKYSGKTLLFGVKISNSTGVAVNTAEDIAVVAVSVDDLLDAITPKTSQIVSTAWTSEVIQDGVTFTVNPDGSALAIGGDDAGDGGHAEIYQAVQVLAGKQYQVDMNVAGNGASDTWFEVYAGTRVPLAADDPNYYDYVDDDNGKLISLNTWSGCGGSPFNGLLSALSCSGTGNTITFSKSGTAYVVIRAGTTDGNLGSTGIKVTNITFTRVN